MVNTGVITAIPAIDPVDKKNKAMPRCRVNQRLSTGVTATGLVKASPTDNNTPKDRKNDQGVRALIDQIDATTTIVTPSNNTNLVPRLATRYPPSGIANP